MKKTTILIICFSFFLISCGRTQQQEGGNKQIEKHNKNDHENHGHNHANKHMHHTPVNELITAFESEERSKTQKPYQVINLLGNINNHKILDIGAGSGYFSFKMAEQGADVIAGDVDDEFLAYIKDKNSKVRLKSGSVVTKKLPYDSPELRSEEIDEAIIVNTYHHIENRVHYFSKVLDGLKPGGKLMVVDFMKKHFEEKVEGPPYEMRIASDIVIKELMESGFDNFQINNDLLPFQYILIAYKNSTLTTTEKTTNKKMKEEFKRLKTEGINKKLMVAEQGISPEDIMRLYYPLEVNPNEGKEKITIESTNNSRSKTTVTLIHDNLLDDSVQAKKIIMDLQQKGSKWLVVSLKKNWKCWKGRGHSTWGIENCN